MVFGTGRTLVVVAGGRTLPVTRENRLSPVVGKSRVSAVVDAVVDAVRVLGRPTWLPAWADSGVSYEHGQAFFGGSLITDLTSIHGAGFDPTAVTGAGMAVTSTNSNRPSAAGAFLDRLTALDFCFAAHFDTTTIDTVAVVMLIDKPDTGNGVAIEWGAGDGLTANMNVTDFQNGQFNTVGVIHANSEHILVGSNNSDGWLSSLNGETAVLDSPHSTGSINPS
jgi:hypothetical protein